MREKKNVPNVGVSARGTARGERSETHLLFDLFELRVKSLLALLQRRQRRRHVLRVPRLMAPLFFCAMIKPTFLGLPTQRSQTPRPRVQVNVLSVFPPPQASVAAYAIREGSRIDGGGGGASSRCTSGESRLPQHGQVVW